MVGYSPQQASPGQREELHVFLSRMDSPEPEREQAVRPIRARDSDRDRHARAKPAGRLVSRGEGCLGSARGHGATLSRPADSVRPLPPPSVREMEPAGLLRLFRVLLSGWPQEGLRAE